MWRTRIVSGLVAALVLPLAAHAETPGGFRAIGPPAMLDNVVFAGDGTAYGTVESGGKPNKVAGSNATVWRSNDHGRTWSASYRKADGAPLALIAASNVNPNTLYASVQTATNIFVVERIDVASAKAIALPFATYLGEDAAGTTPGDGGICDIGVVASKPAHATCGPFAVDPLRAPWDQAWALAPGVFVDRTGAGAMYSLLPLGRVRADWTFESACTTLPEPRDCLHVEPGSIGAPDVWASGRPRHVRRARRR